MVGKYLFKVIIEEPRYNLDSFSLRMIWYLEHKDMESAKMDLKGYLRVMVQEDASDLYLVTGAAPSIKVYGKLKPLGTFNLEANQVKEVAYSIMTPTQIKDFEENPEMNLALSDNESGRFRVNIFRQRNETAMVIRNIKTVIPKMEVLGLPPILKRLIMQDRGLILFVGATGAGKSTSLASLIDYRNDNASGHIITIEDPIEFIHQHKSSIVTQREVGVDTESYYEALKNTLRQAPEVILIGEVRTLEAMEHAVAFAETGYICLTTLHANNANQALERIVNFFPEYRRQQVLLDLSMNLSAIVSQRLIPSVNGGRVAAFEILLGTTFVRDLVKRGEVTELKEVMQKSEHLGMQTMDSALLKLYESGKISMEEALRNADSQNNMRLAISLKSDRIGKMNSGLSIQSDSVLAAEQLKQDTSEVKK